MFIKYVVKDQDDMIGIVVARRAEENSEGVLFPDVAANGIWWKNAEELRKVPFLSPEYLACKQWHHEYTELTFEYKTDLNFMETLFEKHFAQISNKELASA